MHKFVKLGMGLVNENFVVAERSDKKLWEARGFKRVWRYPLFRYTPNFRQVIMLGKPDTLKEFGTDKLKNTVITDICRFLGTYGMGGPGFFGFKLEGEFETRWLVFCIWSAGEHILLDDRVLECYPTFNTIYKPWIKDGKGIKNPEQPLRDCVIGSVINSIVLEDNSIEIHITDKNGVIHTISSFDKSDKFPEQGGTKKKRCSYTKGVMGDYWLVIYDKTGLAV